MAQSIEDFIAATETAKRNLANYKGLVAEYRETGAWNSAKYGITTNPNAPLVDRSASELLAAFGNDTAKLQYNMNEEVFGRKISELENEVGRSAFRAERKSMRIAQGTIDVEDISQEEFISLAKRNQELLNLKDSDPEAFRKIFNPDVTIPGTNEKLMYAIHNGAPELAGGALDPSFTEGTDKAFAAGGGDTKGANRGMAKQFRDAMNADSAVTGLSEEKKAVYRRQLDLITDADTQKKIAAGLPYMESGNFLSAAPPETGVHMGYFGRINERGTKTAAQTAEVAGDLSASTGGRGGMHLIRGVRDYTINTVGLNADYGETALLGKHKPIAGISSMGTFQSAGHEAQLLPISFEEMRNPSGIVADNNLNRIDLAWIEKQINEDVAKVMSGKVPLEEIYGPAAEHAGLKTSLSKSAPPTPNAVVKSMKESEQRVAARVASNRVPETVEETVAVARRASGATEGLLRAGTQASAAVAAGTSNSALLKQAGAALTILKSAI